MEESFLTVNQLFFVSAVYLTFIARILKLGIHGQSSRLRAGPISTETSVLTDLAQ